MYTHHWIALSKIQKEAVSLVCLNSLLSNVIHLCWLCLCSLKPVSRSQLGRTNLLPCLFQLILCPYCYWAACYYPNLVVKMMQTTVQKLLSTLRFDLAGPSPLEGHQFEWVQNVGHFAWVILAQQWAPFWVTLANSSFRIMSQIFGQLNVAFLEATFGFYEPKEATIIKASTRLILIWSELQWLTNGCLKWKDEWTFLSSFVGPIARFYTGSCDQDRFFRC